MELLVGESANAAKIDESVIFKNWPDVFHLVIKI